MPSPDERVVSTFCRICESRCGVNVTMLGNRAVHIGPDKQNPYSWRDFCMKGRSAAELVEDPRRLRSPLRRVGDGYVEASWDEAVEDIAERLGAIRSEHGADAVAAYLGNPVGFNGANGMFFSAFMRALRTRNLFSVSSVDQNNLQRVCFEMYGRWLVPLVPDVDACSYFLLVGMDPAVSTFGWIHNVPDGWRRVLARQRSGATVTVVDPSRTETAAAADHHVVVWPGQDWAFLLGVVKVVLREGLDRPVITPPLTGMAELRALVATVDLDELAIRSGVERSLIEVVAREFAAAQTAMSVCHTGVAHNGAGVLAEWLSHVLNAITGRLDAPGGRRLEPGYVDITTMFGTRPAEPSRVRGLPALAGCRSLAELADEILTPGEGQVRALICNSGNPVVSSAQGDRLQGALDSLDLLVCVDLLQRESHQHADWLLPAAHWLEREDLLTIYSSFEDQPFVQLGSAALAPPDGVREEWELWRDLADAMDLPLFGQPARHAGQPRDLQRRLVESGNRISWEQLEAHPHGLVYGEPGFGHLPEALATSDGSVRLAPPAFLAEVERLLRRPLAAPPADYPLVLSNRRRKASMNSWLNDLPSIRKHGDANMLEVNAEDARRLGLETGDRAAVVSPVATIELDVVVSERTRPGVVVTGHGWGSRVFDPHGGAAPQVWGANRNALTPDSSVDPLSGTPAFATTFVDVRKVES